MRMFPWMPEHKAFIDAEIAKLSVLDPKEAEFMRKQYDEKMAKHEEAEAASQKKVEEALSDGDVSLEDLRLILAERKKKEDAEKPLETSAENEPEVKKRGRKPKHS